jgi:hypothetical protein
MSVAGAAHQIGWILGSKESLFEDRYAAYRRVEAVEVEWATKQALLDANTLPELRKKLPALLQHADLTQMRRPQDEWHPVELNPMGNRGVVDGRFVVHFPNF